MGQAVHGVALDCQPLQLATERQVHLRKELAILLFEELALRNVKDFEFPETLGFSLLFYDKHILHSLQGNALKAALFGVSDRQTLLASLLFGLLPHLLKQRANLKFFILYFYRSKIQSRLNAEILQVRL